MTRRPLQALIINVEDEPFKSIKGQQNAVNAIGYKFCWKTIKKYINEADFFSHIPATLPTLMTRHVEKSLAWAKERVDWPIEKWMTVVFSDESRFTVEGNDGGEHVLRPVGARYHPKYVYQKTSCLSYYYLLIFLSKSNHCMTSDYYSEEEGEGLFLEACFFRCVF
jgi:hypothetical protein